MGFVIRSFSSIFLEEFFSFKKPTYVKLSFIEISKSKSSSNKGLDSENDYFTRLSLYKRPEPLTMYVMKETPRRRTIVTSSLNEIPRGGTT
jgi:hypothetical protein